MAKVENILIGVAVIVLVVACMLFGDWLASGQRQAGYWYCQNAERPQNSKPWTAGDAPAHDEEKTRKATNERHHELCNQWLAAKNAEESARLAWFQLAVGVAGLIGLVFAAYFAASSVWWVRVAIVSQNRAWIGPTAIKFASPPTPDANVELLCCVKNFGAGPSKWINIEARAEVVLSGQRAVHDGVPARQPKSEHQARRDGPVLWPGGPELSLPVQLETAVPFDPSWNAEAGRTLRICGSIIHVHFEAVHETTFGYYLNAIPGEPPETWVFRPCRDGYELG